MTNHTEAVDFLQKQGICKEARTEISIFDHVNNNASKTTLHEIGTSLFRYRWEVTGFNQLL